MGLSVVFLNVPCESRERLVGRDLRYNTQLSLAGVGWGGAAVAFSLASVSHSADLGGRGSWDVAEQRDPGPLRAWDGLGHCITSFPPVLARVRGCL